MIHPPRSAVLVSHGCDISDDLPGADIHLIGPARTVDLRKKFRRQTGDYNDVVEINPPPYIASVHYVQITQPGYFFLTVGQAER